MMALYRRSPGDIQLFGFHIFPSKYEFGYNSLMYSENRPHSFANSYIFPLNSFVLSMSGFKRLMYFPSLPRLSSLGSGGSYTSAIKQVPGLGQSGMMSRFLTTRTYLLNCFSASSLCFPLFLNFSRLGTPILETHSTNFVIVLNS